MIKIILTIITIIFVGLIVYSYTDKNIEHKPVKIEPKKALVEKEVLVPKVKEIKEVKQKKEKVKDSATLNKADISVSTIDEEDAILTFEQSVAEKFSKESTYTGRVYGIADYNGEVLPSSDAEDLGNESPSSLGEWENTERTMDNH